MFLTHGEGISGFAGRLQGASTMAEDLEEDFEEGEGSEDAAEDSPRKRGGGGGNLKKILFIVLPILLVVGALAGAYFGGVFDSLLHSSKPDKPAVAAAATKDDKNGAEPQQTAFYDLPEILVNLNTQGRKQNFLKIRVSLELESAADVPRIEQVMPRIIDNFQVYLRELRVEDLQGSAGMLRLREELLTRVSSAAKPAKINDVLFKEMLVQ